MFQCSDFFPLRLLAQSTNFCSIYRYVSDCKSQNIWRLSVALINYSINWINLILNKIKIFLNTPFFLKLTQFNDLILWPLLKEVNTHIHSFNTHICIIWMQLLFDLSCDLDPFWWLNFTHCELYLTDMSYDWIVTMPVLTT